MLERLREFLRPGLVLNLRFYWVALPLALLASVATFAAGSSFLISMDYLLANILAFAVVGVVFYFARKLMDPRSPKVLTQLVGLGLLLGFAKQVATAVFVVLGDLEGSLLEAIGARAATPLVGLWTVIAIAVITSAQHRFSQLREELISERSRMLDKQQVENSVELAQFAEEATALLRESELRSAKEIADLIRDIAQHKLRPLSHELWDREQSITPGFGGRELTIKALTVRPYPILWTTLLYALGSLQPSVVISGANWWQVLGLSTAPIPVVLAAANWIRRHADVAKENFIGSLVLTSIAGGSAGTLLLYEVGGAANPLLFVTSSWWLGSLIWVVGTFRVALEDFARLRADLEKLAPEELDREALAAVRKIQNRDLANLLHSKTQNRMLAQAMRLESGGDIESELEELRSMLAGLSTSHREQPSAEELTARWDGVLTLNWQLDREPDELTMRVIEEAVANAYRHGLATEVSISLIGSQLVVVDNGLGPKSGGAGLGSSLFDTAGIWSLAQKDEGGGIFRLELSR